MHFASGWRFIEIRPTKEALWEFTLRHIPCITNNHSEIFSQSPESCHPVIGEHRLFIGDIDGNEKRRNDPSTLSSFRGYLFPWQVASGLDDDYTRGQVHGMNYTINRKKNSANNHHNDRPIDNSGGLDDRGVEEGVCLNVPFMHLSTKATLSGEIEKRYVTPFGTVDVIFRAALTEEKRKPYLMIEVGGDAEYWASCDAQINKFRTTLLRFIWGIAKDNLSREVQSAFNEVSIKVKGYEMALSAPWGDTVFGEWKVLNNRRPI